MSDTAPADIPKPTPTAVTAAAPENVVGVKCNVMVKRGPDCLLIRFGVLPQKAIRDVRILLRAPPSCTISAIHCAAPKYLISDENSLLVMIPGVPPLVPAWTQFEIRADDFPSGGVFGAEVRYCNNEWEECPMLRHGQELELPHLMRDAMASVVDTFDADFKALPEESVVEVPFGMGDEQYDDEGVPIVSPTPLPVAPQTIQRHFGHTLAPNLTVEPVGEERGGGFIIAAQVASVGHLVLIRLQPTKECTTTLTATIRCKHKGFADHVAKSLVKKTAGLPNDDGGCVAAKKV